MAVKTSSTGQFMIPTSPAVGITCSSGAANTYTTTYIQQLASTAAAIFIIGAGGFLTSASRPSYMTLQIATGSSGAEAIVGQVQGLQNTIGPAGGTGISATWYTPIYPWIPVATATRIAIKTADSIGGLGHAIQLSAINQANCVDAGVEEAVNTTQLAGQTVTAAAGVTFPSSIHSSGAAVASVTGAVSSVTAAITLPSIPANWITAAGVSSNAIASQATGIASSVTAAVTLPSIPSNWITAAGISGNAFGGQPVSSVTAAITLPSIPSNWITAAGVSSNAIATQPTGVASSVTAAVTLPSIPANWITAAGVSSNAIATQSTGIASSVTAAVTLPGIPNNWITAAGHSAGALSGLAVSSVTAAVTLPGIPTNWITAAGISSGAITLSSGAVPTVTQIRTEIDTNSTKLDTNVASRQAQFSYTTPDNSSIAAIKAKTDQLTFTKANQTDSNILSVFSQTIKGSGTQANPWGP